MNNREASQKLQSTAFGEIPMVVLQEISQELINKGCMNTFVTPEAKQFVSH